MQFIQGNDYFKKIDRRGGLVVEGLSLDQCRFDNCSFSLISSPSNRSIARNILLRDCSLVNCDVGPAVFDEVAIENLAIIDLLICWGALFRHVTFRGKIGSFKVNTTAHHDITPGQQAVFDTERVAFYDAGNWALDIRDASFSELDIRGIPAELIRLDPSRQFTIRRRTALDWKRPKQLSKLAEHWMFAVELFISDGDNDRVLSVPNKGTQKQQNDLLEGLVELRQVGLIK